MSSRLLRFTALPLDMYSTDLWRAVEACKLVLVDAMVHPLERSTGYVLCHSAANAQLVLKHVAQGEVRVAGKALKSAEIDTSDYDALFVHLRNLAMLSAFGILK